MQRADEMPQFGVRLKRPPLRSHLAAHADTNPREAVLLIDPHGRIRAWSGAAERLYGLSAAEVLGSRFAVVVSSHRNPSYDAELAPLVGRSGVRSGPSMHRVNKSGREIPVKVAVVPLQSDAPDPGYLMTVCNDSDNLLTIAAIEERLRFEVLLSELAARFTGLAEDQIDGEIELWLQRLVEALGVDRSSFAELTPDGVITITHTYAAPAIEWPHRGPAEQRFPWLTREFGAGRMVVLSRIPDDLPPDAVAERNYFIGIGMTSGIGIPIFVAGELICVLTFGYFRGAREWPADLVSRLHLAGNAFANAIERRRAKQRLEQKQQELAHVSRVAAMGELASVIAHELDQPLTAIVSNAEAVGCLLKSKPPDLREAGEAIQDVIGAAMRASEIVRRERRLLRKSRLEFQLLDLNDAVREIELFIRGEARQAGAQITLELAAELPPIMGDRIQLQQVILNMARNAVQAMRDQPVETREFRIRTAAGDAEVTLSVTDAGPPTDQMALEQMFEPFYTTKPNGLGMGLAISRSILDGHHGRIWATRNPGRGIMVNIAIPRK